MEVEDIQTQGCNNNELKRGTAPGAGGADDGVNRLRGWHHSRIIRVSRASGGKDRHSKVWTSKGLRDRRVRLSVTTAIQFYDLQDRLGYDQPSKAVEWLIKAAADSISELPSLNSSFNSPEMEEIAQNQQISVSKSSSTSETSKGSGLSLAQSDVRVNRVKARERARERAAKEKEKEKEFESRIGHGHNVNPNSQTSSFTELLTGSAQQNSTGRPWPVTTPMDYAASSSRINCSSGFSPFNVLGENQHDLQHFSFLPDNFIPVLQPGVGDYYLNFTNSSGLAGFNRGTLQSNSPSIMPQLQRFSPIDGSNLPFFIGTPPLENHHPHQLPPRLDGRLQLCYGDGTRLSDQKGKGKN